jgi:hypothetical protein
MTWDADGCRGCVVVAAGDLTDRWGGSLGVLFGPPVRSVMGLLKRFPKCPCAREAEVRVRRRAAAGNRGLYACVIGGELAADLLVEDVVIVEPDVAGALSDVHLPQCRPACRSFGAGGPDRENHPASSPLIPRYPPYNREAATTGHIRPAGLAIGGIRTGQPVQARRWRQPLGSGEKRCRGFRPRRVAAVEFGLRQFPLAFH